MAGELASDSVQSNYQNYIKKEHTQILLEAFFDKRDLEITYQRADGEQSNRTIEIYYLFLNWPIWYLIAWDYLREAPRTFRLDRISETNMRSERFRLKLLHEFSSELVQFSKPSLMVFVCIFIQFH
jgi:predicted DNA-binding transcriptional regulator YafY